MKVEVMGRGGRNVDGEEGREGQNRQTSKWNGVFRTTGMEGSQAGAKYHASRSLRNPRTAPEPDRLKVRLQEVTGVVPHICRTQGRLNQLEVLNFNRHPSK